MPNKKIITLAVFVSAILIYSLLANTKLSQAAPWQYAPIMNNGPTSEKVDIVFLGDGFTGGELETYRGAVSNSVNYLMAEPPFSQYRNYFNIWRVDVISNQSGVDNECTGALVDTALDAGYKIVVPGDCRRLWTDSANKVYEAAASAPAADLILIIVNSGDWGGGAGYGTYALAPMGATGPEILAHETGHAFAKLGDEYFDIAAPPYTGPEPPLSNITAKTVRALIKWERWIDKMTELPTLTQFPDTPGLYTGAYGYPSGVYRPTFESKMRVYHQPFETVNSDVIITRIFDFIPPDGTPPSASATINNGVQTVYSSNVTSTITANDAESYVKAYRISNDPSFSDAKWQFASNQSSFSDDIQWALAPGIGTRTVYTEVENGYGQITPSQYSVTVEEGVDIGLKAYDGSQVIRIAVEPAGTLTSPLRIRKGDTTYGIILVDRNDPNASKIIINTPSGLKALKKKGADYLLAFATVGVGGIEFGGITGNEIGGISGANNICQNAASAGGLPGTYYAWISDSSSASAPANRFTTNTKSNNYAFRRVDGALIAQNWNQLISGTLTNPINKNQVGAAPGAFSSWTNTNPNGTVINTAPIYSCTNWTSYTESSVTGYIDYMDTRWTSDHWEYCGSPGVLYCFQQAP